MVYHELLPSANARLRTEALLYNIKDINSKSKNKKTKVLLAIHTLTQNLRAWGFNEVVAALKGPG
jgi:hypothetical protein